MVRTDPDRQEPPTGPLLESLAGPGESVALQNRPGHGALEQRGRDIGLVKECDVVVRQSGLGQGTGKRPAQPAVGPHRPLPPIPPAAKVVCRMAAQYLELPQQCCNLPEQALPARLCEHLGRVGHQIADRVAEGRGHPHVGHILPQIRGGNCRKIFFDARRHGVPGLEQTDKARF